jgi:sugar O-acyltransferase (sialic acid O-acetyltransferase NeuD family)
MSVPATKIAYVGFGELGRQVSALVSESGVRQEKFLFDDNCHAEALPNAFPFEEHAADRFAELQFYVCLGYKHLTRKTAIVHRLLEAGRNLPSLVHHSAYVSPSASVGKGTVVYPMCNLDKEVTIGRGAVLNNSVVVSHNATIGDGCYLAPGVIISGFVNIGRNCFLGSGAVVSNDVSIGENVLIGIGTVVTHSVPDNCSVIGNPMRLLKKPLRLG